MPRHGLARFSATLFMVWFAFFTSEPAQLHLCPVHDGHMQHSASAPMPGHDLPGHAGHHCTCAGTCCSANHVAVPQVAPSIGTAVAISSPASPRNRSSQPVAAPKHLRPPSIGPPALHFA